MMGFGSLIKGYTDNNPGKIYWKSKGWKPN